MDKYLLETAPIALVCALVATLILLSCEIGFTVGRRFRARHADETASTQIGPVIGSLLGMLAFVLAFTFSMAAGQHAVRKQNVLDEANAIDDVYLRADLLAPDAAERVRALLREYVDLRLAVTNEAAIAPALARSSEIHRELWRIVSASARTSKDVNSQLVLLAVNGLIDMHSVRVAGALRARIPGSVWLGLLTITVLTMGSVGLQLGLAGKRRIIALIPLSLSFAVLVTLVVDLNRPQGGTIVVGQAAMRDLRDFMAVPP